MTTATSESEIPRVEIFTDGGCSPNPGVGAWGALLRFGTEEKEISGYVASTTNNRMEMTAALEALNSLKRGCNVRLWTDSQYLRQGITSWITNWKKRGWRSSTGKPVLNQDLWQALSLACERHQIDWQWVRGHSGHIENERVDALVTRTLQAGRAGKTL